AWRAGGGAAAIAPEAGKARQAAVRGGAAGETRGRVALWHCYSAGSAEAVLRQGVGERPSAAESQGHRASWPGDSPRRDDFGRLNADSRAPRASAAAALARGARLNESKEVPHFRNPCRALAGHLQVSPQTAFSFRRVVLTPL